MRSSLAGTVFAVILLIVMGVLGYRQFALTGSGNVIGKQVEIEDIDRVRLSGAAELVIEQSDEHSLTIKAEDNVMPMVKAKVTGGRLDLSFRPGFWDIRPAREVRFELKVKQLERLEVEGAGAVTVESLKADTLEIVGRESAAIGITGLEVEELRAEFDGPASCAVSGEAPELTVIVKGSGRYESPDLRSDNVTVEVGGSGKAKVWAGKTLDVKITGSGKVEYFGDPEVTRSIDGVGVVRALGPK